MTLVRRAVIGALAAYTLAHFVYSGVLVPLQSPNIRQIAYETRTLVAHLATGDPVIVDEADQYGPAFLFVMHPLLLACGSDPWPLSRCLYGVQLMALGASFLFMFLSLRLWLRARGTDGLPSDLGLAGALALLWLNFAPLYYIVTTKMVETWELALILGALYALMRGAGVLAGVAIAVATFIKLLPGIFVIYFALYNRRALAGFGAGTVAVLAVAHIMYGPAMGFGYPLHIAKAAVVPSEDAATGFHVNLSMKNLVWKAFGDLQVPGPDDAPMREAYVAEVDADAQPAATRIGLLLHAAAVVATILLLWPGRRALASDPVWVWGFLSVAMLIVAPAATFEYMILALPGFSVVVAALLAVPRLRRRRALIASFGVAIVLVAHIVPRTVINAVLPIDALRQASGYTHLTLSETYQYFGIPLFGLLALGIALVLLGRELRRAEEHA
jgi:hypothetical protein